jgi:hypothetical protein
MDAAGRAIGRAQPRDAAKAKEAGGFRVTPKAC